MRMRPAYSYNKTRSTRIQRGLRASTSESAGLARVCWLPVASKGRRFAAPGRSAATVSASQTRRPCWIVDAACSRGRPFPLEPPECWVRGYVIVCGTDPTDALQARVPGHM